MHIKKLRCTEISKKKTTGLIEAYTSNKTQSWKTAKNKIQQSHDGQTLADSTALTCRNFSYYNVKVIYVNNAF